MTQEPGGWSEHSDTAVPRASLDTAHKTQPISETDSCDDLNVVVQKTK